MDNFWTMATALMTALLVTMKCWENCQLLQSNFPVWGAICDEKGICFPGCKEACQFHVESEMGQRVPVIQTPRGEGVIRVSGGVASWPKPPRSHGGGPYVYVLMRRVGERPWRQISQGLQTSARVPEGGTLRVLVVDRNGLVTIYSPSASGSGRLEDARRVLESVGRTDLLGPVVQGPPQPGKRINTEIALPTTSLPSAILEDSRRTGPRRSGWTLREVSLIHQKVLVIAEIAWEARGAAALLAQQQHQRRRPLYFVFWEVEGGGLSGNLFTDSTSVTLSLWPDTVYHIQADDPPRAFLSGPGDEGWHSVEQHMASLPPMSPALRTAVETNVLSLFCGERRALAVIYNLQSVTPQALKSSQVTREPKRNDPSMRDSSEKHRSSATSPRRRIIPSSPVCMQREDGRPTLQCILGRRSSQIGRVHVDVVVRQAGGSVTHDGHDTSRIVSLERSEELVVDTSRAVGVEWEPASSQQQQQDGGGGGGPVRREPTQELRGHELALGIAAALAAFALLLAALTLVMSARQRRRPPAGKLQPPSPPPLGAIARVFPPKVCVGLLSEDSLCGGAAGDWPTDGKLPRSTLHV